MKTNPTEIFEKIPEMEYEEPIIKTSVDEFEKILKNRRSVRVFTSEKVPSEVMEKVLEWGLMAPNSSNLQPWEFYWVQNFQKKSQLIKACFNQPAAKTAQELIVCVARIDKWRNIRNKMLTLFKQKNNVPSSAHAYYEKLVPLVYSQGPLNLFGYSKKLIISIVGIFRPVPRGPSSKADMFLWASKSTALACQNLMMGFSAYGYDTCPMEGFDANRVKKILGLGRNSEITMIISVGKRDKRGVYGERIRMPKEEFIKKII
jgi:nitroreductase